MIRNLKVTFLFLFFFNCSYAQIDSIGPVNNQIGVKKKWYKTRVFKAAVVPSLLFGYGVTTIRGNGLYSSYDAKRDVQKHLGGAHSQIDDFLVFAPYIELVALNLLKIKCQNDFINTGLLIIKSQLIMTAIVFPMKRLTHIQRPDSSNYESFPSGHTAQAFLAASIVHKEFRHKSQWYGVGAYTIATSVALFRMINNKHWQSDVFAGAGIGILSAHIAYLTHQNRWGRKCDMVLVPTYQNKSMQMSMSIMF